MLVGPEQAPSQKAKAHVATDFVILHIQKSYHVIFAEMTAIFVPFVDFFKGATCVCNSFQFDCRHLVCFVLLIFHIK